MCYIMQIQAILELMVEGQEDCLVLNVYTPQLSNSISSDKKAVMVYIHGGGFWWGAGYEYQPTYAMDHDIVSIQILGLYMLAKINMYFKGYGKHKLPHGTIGIFS